MINRFATGGPDFTIETDRLFIGLGHTERKATGIALAEAAEAKKIFSEIDIITLNKGAAILGRKALRTEMGNRLVLGHSAFVTRLQSALQAVAVNPPEPTGLVDLFTRANGIMSDPVEKEDNAHKTGPADMAGAGFEMLRSPASTVATIAKIVAGYSTIDELANAQDRFPAGRAIVHSELDGFQFPRFADSSYANQKGITTLMLPGHYHNELLFAPARTLDLMTPTIFPET